MFSEEKRGIYGGSSYNSSKITNETEYEVRLRIIKEKYEERLEAITDKIRCIYDNIRKDKVIATMRSDPTSSIFVSDRMREICQDHLALEREETIDRLTEEVAFSQMELKKIEKDMKDFKKNIESMNENLQNERLKFLNIEQENKTLRNKLNSFAAEFEKIQKKNIENANDAIKMTAFESEKIKEALENAERNLWQKSKENEILFHESEKNKEKITNLTLDINKLDSELKEKDLLLRNNTEILNQLKYEIDTIKNEREDLKNKHASYGHQFKDIIETEEKSHQEIIKELNIAYKDKSSRFKKKIIDQKKIISALENEISISREVVENSKHGQERSLITAQEDLKKVKDQWEKRCKDIEKEYSLQILDLNTKHQNQIAELQKHYQELLEEKIKEFTYDSSFHMSKQKALDYELKRLVDEKISQIEKDYINLSKHENILHEETSKLRIKHLQEIREIEENCNKELFIRIKDLKDQNLLDTEKLSDKIKAMDHEKAEILSAKRIAESELQFAQEKLENFGNKINSLKQELNEAENARKTLQQKLEENLYNMNKLKNQHEEELQKKKKLQIEIETEKEKNENLQNSLNDIEKDFTFKQQNFSMSYQGQISEYQENIQKEQQKLKKLSNDLEYYQNLCAKLEGELNELKDFHLKETQDLFTSSQRSKQEEYLKYEKEVESHLETKRQLIQADHKAKFLASELEASEKHGNDLRVFTSKYEKENLELRRTITSLENAISQYEKLNIKLKTEIDKSREEQSSIRITSKKELKEKLDRLRYELKSLSKNSAQELVNFKKVMTSGVVETLYAVEDYQNRSKRMADSKIYEKEQEIKSIKEEKYHIEEELNQSLSIKDNYENNIEQLRSNINQLKWELSEKNKDIELFSKKIEDFHYDQNTLEDEKHRLEEELRITYNNLDSYRQESIEYKSKWKYSKENQEKGLDSI